MWSPLAMSLVPQRMAYALEAVVNPSTIRLAIARILVFFMLTTQGIGSTLTLTHFLDQNSLAVNILGSSIYRSP